VSAAELEQIEKAGALKVLADEGERLATQLQQLCRWLDDNYRLERHKMSHPLDEGFRTQVGVGNWTLGHDKLTTFQDDFKAHLAYLAKEFPYLETVVTKQRERYAMSRELDEARVLEMLTSHSTALRAEASHILEAFSA
jgi:hypothetical protein